MNLFVKDQRLIRLNVKNFESKNRKKEFLNLNQNKLNLKNIKNVWMERKIKENVIFTFFVQLTKKCILKK